MHTTYTRLQFVRILSMVRQNYCALCVNGIFTANNMDDKDLLKEGRLRASQDPMGTMAAAVSIVKWLLTHDHVVDHGLGYASRCIGAVALFVAHKVKSEDSWPEGLNIAAKVLGMFFGPCGGNEVHGNSELAALTMTDECMSHDLFRWECKLIWHLPMHSLCEENMCAYAEREIYALYDSELMDAEATRVALGRIFVYFYYCVAMLDKDFFEDEATDMSECDMGLALVCCVIHNTEAHAAADKYSAPVQTLARRVIKAVLVWPRVGHPDCAYLRLLHKRERTRLLQPRVPVYVV